MSKSNDNSPFQPDLEAIQKSIELVKKTQVLYNIIALHSIAILLQFIESITYSKINDDTHSIIMIYGFFVLLPTRRAESHCNGGENNDLWSFLN